jgi:hypothetical protein
MRKTKRYIRTIGHGMLAFAWVAMSGCADDWDAHYDGQPRPEQTLWQEISSRPELADFAKLLQSRGYDKYLDSDQRYTVWAPVGHRYDIGDGRIYDGRRGLDTSGNQPYCKGNRSGFFRSE